MSKVFKNYSYNFNERKRKERNKDKSLEQCKICDNRYKSLRHHINNTHLMNAKEYNEYVDNPKDKKRRA